MVSTVFGRDALISAWQMLWMDPAVARGVLLHLAANQATRLGPETDAEPGKILHEQRQGEMAETGEVPFRRDYGSVDATPLFVMLAGAYFDRTCNRAMLSRLWPHVRAALDWIDRHGDRDGDGFVEYGTRSGKGLATYALALDGDKRPCRVRSSNAGQLLWSGIVPRERAGALVRTLTGPSSFCGWGVRTIAAGEARYNPMSYHNGSVWPHDNALIAEGLARYGFRDEAARIFEGIFAAASHVDLRRLPELFCGFPRRRAQGPTLYPVA